MKKSPEKLIAFLENYNAWRRGSYRHEQPVPEELGQCLDQAVEMLKTMTWQPMETAPKDREFLAVWGSPMDVQDKSVDLFRYDQEAQHYALSSYGGAVYVPLNELFAWMEIPKYEP
jgi:hypothetical protein